MIVREINELLNKIAPYKTAYDFDNVGLLLGDGERQVKKIMLALDVAPEVVEQAVAEKVQLLITHHPLIFKPMKKITADDPVGKMILRLIENNIAVIAVHTNWDIATHGVNDILANLVELDNIRVASDVYNKDFVKLNLFVPTTHTKQIIELLDSLQIKIFGNYQSCSFTTEGTGRFKPLVGAKPFVGTEQELSSVAEERIELVMPRSRVHEVLNQVKAVHPYEQMAYDVMTVEQPCAEHGLMRIGDVPEPMDAMELAEHIKEVLNLEYAFVSHPEKPVGKLAVCGGAGADFIEAAKRAGADALLTGDIKYHEAQSAKYLDLAVIAIGHQESEETAMYWLANMLQKQASLKNIKIMMAKQEQILYFV